MPDDNAQPFTLRPYTAEDLAELFGRMYEVNDLLALLDHGELRSVKQVRAHLRILSSRITFNVNAALRGNLMRVVNGCFQALSEPGNGGDEGRLLLELENLSYWIAGHVGDCHGTAAAFGFADQMGGPAVEERLARFNEILRHLADLRAEQLMAQYGSPDTDEGEE